QLYRQLQNRTGAGRRGVPVLDRKKKVSADMIWANDFHYVKYTQSNSNSSGKGGVGGGGGKAGGSGSTEYFYFASLMYAVCEGPIAGIIAIRNGSTWVYF